MARKLKLTHRLYGEDSYRHDLFSVIREELTSVHRRRLASAKAGDEGPPFLLNHIPFEQDTREVAQTFGLTRLSLPADCVDPFDLAMVVGCF